MSTESSISQIDTELPPARWGYLFSVAGAAFPAWVLLASISTWWLLIAILGLTVGSAAAYEGFIRWGDS